MRELLRGYRTPRSEQLAREGLRLTQFLVEPACTPSRAALMTGQYSIRNGLSLIIVPGSETRLPGKAFTLAEELNVQGLFGLGRRARLRGDPDVQGSLKAHPNPLAANITRF